MPKKEHKKCFYCNALVTGNCEDDHFPIPSAAGGSQTVPCCISCHDMKDRYTLADWPIEWVTKTIADFHLFSRETKLLLAKIIRCFAVSQERVGVRIEGMSEKIDVITAATAVSSLQVALQGNDSDRIAERTSSAIDLMRQERKRISGRIPFGYDLADDGETLTQNPVEMVVLERIRAARAEGRSLRAIAAELNADKIPAKLGGLWGASTIQSILGVDSRRAVENDMGTLLGR
jgi:Recombinase